MGEGQYLIFGPFRLELTRDRLWRGQEVVELRAKPLAVLRYLVDHAGEVVTRDEIQQPVWAGIYVSKTALRVCIREIREALGDEATAPQYIETVGRQGYRFIAPLTTTLVASSQYPVVSRQQAVGSSQHLTTDYWILPSYFVGREQELAQLQQVAGVGASWRPTTCFCDGRGRHRQDHAGRCLSPPCPGERPAVDCTWAMCRAVWRRCAVPAALRRAGAMMRAADRGIHREDLVLLRLRDELLLHLLDLLRVLRRRCSAVWLKSLFRL